jgi:Uma2 family endonuclease
MVAASAFSYVSPEDYLAAEATNPIKHEYRDGEVYAMAGGTDAHVTIALNLWALLRAHLRNQSRRCSLLSTITKQIRLKSDAWGTLTGP